MSPEDIIRRQKMIDKMRSQVNKSDQMLQSDRPDLYDRKTGWMAPSIDMGGVVTSGILPSSLNDQYLSSELPKALLDSGYTPEEIKSKVFDRILNEKSDKPRIIVDPDWKTQGRTA